MDLRSSDDFRESKKIHDPEETQFTDHHKPSRKSRGATGPHYRKPNPTCLENTTCYFCNFCANTSIHGFKFLGEPGRYFIEKVLWFFIVCGAAAGSATFIYKTYHKWVTSPVLVTFAMTETPIYEIPFPAVTVCPELKIDRTVFNYTDVYLKYYHGDNTTQEEDDYFNIFKLVCNDLLLTDSKEGAETLSEEDLDKFNKAFLEFTPAKCRWLGTNYDCDDIMSYTLTSEGRCRTFNMLAYEEVYVDAEDYKNRTIPNTTSHKWSLEGGYPQTADLDSFPRRTILAGAKSGFELQMFLDGDDLDYLCSGLQGFKVALHHPAEEPDMDKHFRVPLDQAVIAGIRPRMITTSEEIIPYNPEERHCFVQGEKILSNYKIYTQPNCMAECLTNYTLKTCGCVGFYVAYNGEAAICGTGKKNCVEEAKVTFLASDVKSRIKKSEENNKQHCGCLPACTSLEFDAETSQTDWNWRKSLNIQLEEIGAVLDLNKLHFSKVIVYYKDMQFMTSERHELYGVADFLGTCGGLLGLFCGFSFTSAMEILYYLTLRLICNVRKFGRTFWSGSPDLRD